jgi:uncharacterized LabA/DUF88 family protein
LRAAIFIDGGYFLNKVKTHKIVPDYKRLVDHLLEPVRSKVPLDLLRCYFYYCPPWMSNEPTAAEQKRMEAYEQFVMEIQKLDRWALRLGKLQRRTEGDRDYFEQKRVDVLLSCDMVRHSAAGHIQHAVLLAGDSDFIPAVELTKESGVTVTLWCGESNSVHEDLVNLCDEVHRFDWGKLPQLAAQNPSNTRMVPPSEHLERKEGRSSGAHRGDQNRSKSNGGQSSSSRSHQKRDQEQGERENASADQRRRRSGSRRRPRRSQDGQSSRPSSQRDQNSTAENGQESQSFAKAIASRLKKLTQKISS